MKKLLVIFIAFFFISCGSEPVEDPYKYCGGEVVSFGRSFNDYWIKIRYENEIIRPIYVVKYDYMSLEIGNVFCCDSIKKRATKPIPIKL